MKPEESDLPDKYSKYDYFMTKDYIVKTIIALIILLIPSYGYISFHLGYDVSSDDGFEGGGVSALTIIIFIFILFLLTVILFDSFNKFEEKTQYLTDQYYQPPIYFINFLILASINFIIGYIYLAIIINIAR